MPIPAPNSLSASAISNSIFNGLWSRLARKATLQLYLYPDAVEKVKKGLSRAKARALKRRPRTTQDVRLCFTIDTPVPGSSPEGTILLTVWCEEVEQLSDTELQAALAQAGISIRGMETAEVGEGEQLELFEDDGSFPDIDVNDDDELDV